MGKSKPEPLADKLTKSERKRLRLRITRYVQSAIDMSWMGSTDPEGHEDTKNEFDTAWQSLHDFIDKL